MTKSQKVLGQIIVPFGALPQNHELNTAKILIRSGDNVKFIPPSSRKSADIVYQNLIWEIKSPIGKSSRTIENSLRSALKQSCNVIIDLRRIQLAEAKCFNYFKNHLHSFSTLKRLLIIDKKQKVIKITKKRACALDLTVLK